jgi:glucose-6-phosphate 1-epimerase
MSQLVFPQFGPDGPLPNHGFARTSAWNFAGVGEDGSATFELVPTEATRAIWDSDFRLQFTVTARATGFTSVLQ